MTSVRWPHLLLLLTAACTSRTPAPHAVLGCALPVNADRWNPAGRTVADFPLTDSGATPVAGATVIGAEVFVFDRFAGLILAVALDGTVRRRIGRDGRGPGELAIQGTSTRLSLTRLRRDWLASRGDTLLLLDGNQIHRFLTSGAHVGSERIMDTLLGEPSIFPSETTRLRVTGDRLWLDVSALSARPGAPFTSASRSYSIWSVSAESIRLELRLPLIPPLVTERGAVMLSVLEARPAFDLVGTCLVVTDGGSPFVIVHGASGTSFDTIPIAFALRDPKPPETEVAVRQASGAGAGPLPAPSLPARLQRIVGDPDGWVWIMPVQSVPSEGEIEVIRLHIPTGTQRLDSVPFFPTAFLANGSLLAVDLDSLGSPRLRIAEAASGR